MDSTSYIGAAGMKAAYRALEVAANNMANVNTTGFKADTPFYRLLIDEAAKLSGSALVGTDTDFTNGAIRRSGNPLDVAINGPGFFAVRDQAGQVRYTRNGAFTLSQAGELVTHDGHQVLDSGNRPIFVATGPEALGDITISHNGEVTVGDMVVGSIAVFDPGDLDALRKVGAQNFETDQQPQPLFTPHLEQGALESSNVNAVSAMLELIEVNRFFDINQKTVNATMNGINRKVINEINA